MPLVEPGKKAPAFTLKDQDGKTHTLSDYAGSPSCCTSIRRTTRQVAPPKPAPSATIFRSSRRARPLSLASASSTRKARRSSRRKYDVNFPLLADPDHAIAEKYGVWQEKSRYGRKYMGIARTTYLIDASGKVARRWDNVKVDGHTEVVLNAVHEL